MQSSIATQRLFASLDSIEVEVVAWNVTAAETLGLTRLASAATRLGNGWLYPLVTCILLGFVLDAPLRFLFAAALSLVIAFATYPGLKKFLRRMRPCDYDPALLRGRPALDTYSCPSGHAMTAAAYGVPLLFAWPAAWPVVVASCVVIAWSRVALGHHYVSDVLAGTVLGAAIAGAVGTFLY